MKEIKIKVTDETYKILKKFKNCDEFKDDNNKIFYETYSWKEFLLKLYKNYKFKPELISDYEYRSGYCCKCGKPTLLGCVLEEGNWCFSCGMWEDTNGEIYQDDKFKGLKQYLL